LITLNEYQFNDNTGFWDSQQQNVLLDLQEFDAFNKGQKREVLSSRIRMPYVERQLMAIQDIYALSEQPTE
jgi:hypothetical protein